MIIKIEKPAKFFKGQHYRIYNQDRSVDTNNSLKVGEIPEIDNLFEKNEKEIYVKGYISKNGRDLVINRKVTGQEW